MRDPHGAGVCIFGGFIEPCIILNLEDGTKILLAMEKSNSLFLSFFLNANSTFLKVRYINISKYNVKFLITWIIFGLYLMCNNKNHPFFYFNASNYHVSFLPYICILKTMPHVLTKSPQKSWNYSCSIAFQYL